MKTITRSIMVVLLHFTFFSIAQTNVQITNCQNTSSTYEFRVNGSAYKPLVCNYTIEFVQDPSGNWYISPTRQYSSNPGTLSWEFDPNNAANTVVIAKNKLISDLNRIRSLGFTEIRLVGVGLLNTGTNDAPVYQYPTGNQATYFNLLNTFFTQISTANLRVIYMLGGGAEYMDNNNTTYKNFISSVAANFSSNPAVMAYDLMNEPHNGLIASGPNNKYNLSKMINEWHDCIKKNDPNHLTTIGLQAPWDLYAYDPFLMKVDFVSYHLYTTNTNLTTAKNNMDIFLYWLGKTIHMPWIIGETGYSGMANPTAPNVGTEADQLAYTQHTLQKSVDCNCKGYSWWQYQEVHWGDPLQDHFGLFYPYSGNTEGAPKQVAYPATNPNPSPFIAYNTLSQNTGNCSKPSNYYTVFNGSVFKGQGYVKDNNGNPIENAVVIGKDGAYGNFMTFTDATGYYRIGTSGSGLINLSVSYPGYSNISINNPSASILNHTLTKVNHNSWAKEWSNNSTTSVLNNDWISSPNDKFYKGDFNGDGQEDLLCVRYTSNNNDRMAIYTYKETFSSIGGNYHNLSSNWTLIWDNQSNSANGGGIYPYRNNLVVGDFDGDKKDDVISINATSAGWTTWFKFSPNTNPVNATWVWMDSNYGTTGNPMAAMAPYYQNVISGDFYNQGKAAIMGVSGSWITTFELVNNVWTWVQSNSGQTNNPGAGYELSYLTPYRSQLIAGDFDGTGKKEVLGSVLPNGAMALFKPTWNSATNTWKWVNSSASPYWIDATNYSGLYAYRNNLVIGNFDSDKSDEILGINSSACAIFDFVNWTSSNASSSWDGVNYPVISDWSITSATSKYLFLKTTPNASQQELLAIKNNSAFNFTSGLYAFRPNPASSWPCTTLIMANNNSEMLHDLELEEAITLYPNPNNGEFTISFSENFDQDIINITIADVQGKQMFNRNFNNRESHRDMKISLGQVTSGVYYLKVVTPVKSYTKKVVIM